MMFREVQRPTTLLLLSEKNGSNIWFLISSVMPGPVSFTVSIRYRHGKPGGTGIHSRQFTVIELVLMVSSPPSGIACLRIGHQIQEKGRKTGRVNGHRFQFRGLYHHQSDGITDDMLDNPFLVGDFLVYVYGFNLCPAFPAEFKHALGKGRCLFPSLADLIYLMVERVGFIHRHLQDLGITVDDRKHIIEIMCEPAGDLGKDFHACRVEHALLLHLLPDDVQCLIMERYDLIIVHDGPSGHQKIKYLAAGGIMRTS